MKLKELYTLLETSGIPFAYYQWERGGAPPPPFGVYFLPESDFVYADDSVYFPRYSLVIEIYTKQKDPTIERKIETLLEENDFVYSKYESYIESEEVYQIRYNTEVIIDGE